MLVTIQLQDTRFDGMGFTTDETNAIVREMFTSGVYTPDEYTSGVSITVTPTNGINTNVPADPANAI